MRYVGKLYRPPSEAHSLILQATIGCSWNHCTYCDMYRDKPRYLERPVADCLADLEGAAARFAPSVEKLFVADGDALGLPMDHWVPILEAARRLFPRLRQVSCYAMARNVLDKTAGELRTLQELGLKVLYVGPESGDDVTLKKIAKGGTFAEHVAAAERARAAELTLSVILLLGAGGVARTAEHAEASARLVTAMDPRYLSALTLTVVPGTPHAKLEASGRFELPDIHGLLAELSTIIDLARPTDALFRTNHASNYLPLRGSLPRDREALLRVLDDALAGRVPLRPEHWRGL